MPLAPDLPSGDNQKSLHILSKISCGVWGKRHPSIILLHWEALNLQSRPPENTRPCRPFQHSNLSNLRWTCVRSDQISLSVMSNSLWPHESQHARPPCPSPTPGVHWDSRSSSQWCHPAISSSVVPFSSCPQSLPASESFPISQLFVWGGQSTGVSALASFLPKKSQGDLLQNGLVGSPCSPRDSQDSSPTPQFKSINSSAFSLLHSPTFTSIHDHRKNHSLD